MLLLLLLLIPFVAAGLVLIAPARWARWVGLAAAAAHLGTAFVAWYADRVLTRGPYQPARLLAWSVEARAPWFGLDLGPLGRLQVDFWLGLDGLSAPLVLLTGVVGLLGVGASWHLPLATTDRPRGFFSLYLLLLAAVSGCFVAVDMVLFYVFCEVMLLPMYFLIGIWGGARRELAAVKFFLYTLLGSLLILVVIVALFPVTHGYGLPALTDFARHTPGQWLSPAAGGATPARLLAFGLLLAGFGIKLPIVPFHTWLPDAHVEAPTPISVVLAGLLLKVGAYGLLRFTWPLFPDAARALAPVVAGLGAISILYGALCALAQTDLKKLVAYSSVSHMGFVLLGFASLTPEGVGGAVFQLVSHGLISSLLFLLVGVLYDRTHSRAIGHYRGLAGPLPRFAAATVIGFFAALGLPGFSGFIAEILVLLGTWQSALVPAASGRLPLWTAIVPLAGLLVGAGYCLWTVQRLLFGPYWVHPKLDPPVVLPDLTVRERWLLGSLCAATLGLGVFPAVLLAGISPVAAVWVPFVRAALP
ncbi:MAG: NADH-quinone oxidoreductase subunit M [Hymenobacteraceae bacterium]|nr:NADH-quinone oxidoreductase subunit M [Hymenobacteraceae bacterium]